MRELSTFICGPRLIVIAGLTAWLYGHELNVMAEDLTLAADECVVRFVLPDTAQVTVNVKEYGAKRKLNYKSLKKGTHYSLDVKVRFDDGSEVSRDVLIHGGWSVDVPPGPKLVPERELAFQAGGAFGKFAAISGDGRLILFAGYYGAELWDAHRSVKLRDFPLTLNGGDAALSPDGSLVATSWTEGSVNLVDALTGRSVRKLWSHSGDVRALDFSPDGQTLVTASDDHTAVLWDVASGQQLHRLRGHSDKVSCAAFSHDGRLVATGSADSSVIIWDVASGHQLRLLGKKDIGSVSAVKFSADDERLFVAANNRVNVWDTENGRRRQQLTIGDVDIGDLDLSPNGEQLVVAVEDETRPRAIL